MEHDRGVYIQTKIRVQWLKLGDLDNRYFFAQMKGRRAQN